jgi:hypothetical protein
VVQRREARAYCNRRCSRLSVASRRSLARAAWRRLARIWGGGVSADGVGDYMGVLRGKGARVLNRNQRDFRVITLGDATCSLRSPWEE